MITNIPTSEDFIDHGLMFLNLAWDSVFDLRLGSQHILDGYKYIALDGINIADQLDNYWEAAKRPLSIAHALAQQGAELVLKSEVAGVSPFLLVSNPPANWPRKNGKVDTAFADFRTIDAQDLVRACNMVRNDPLPKQLVTTFDKFRKQRNALFHTVDDRLEFSEKEIIRYILAVVQLIKPCEWPSLRRDHLEMAPEYEACAIGSVMDRLCHEMRIMVDMLEHSELLEWFRFNKRQRRYICPRCYGELEQNHDRSFPITAQLRPNTPNSTNLHCFVCGYDIPATREKCQKEDCKGNVIHTKDDIECLTCFEAQER